MSFEFASLWLTRVFRFDTRAPAVRSVSEQTAKADTPTPTTARKSDTARAWPVPWLLACGGFLALALPGFSWLETLALGGLMIVQILLAHWVSGCASDTGCLSLSLRDLRDQPTLAGLASGLILAAAALICLNLLWASAEVPLPRRALSLAVQLSVPPSVLVVTLARLHDERDADAATSPNTERESSRQAGA